KPAFGCSSTGKLRKKRLRAAPCSRPKSESGTCSSGLNSGGTMSASGLSILQRITPLSPCLNAYTNIVASYRRRSEQPRQRHACAAVTVQEHQRRNSTARAKGPREGGFSQLVIEILRCVGLTHNEYKDRDYLNGFSLADPN